MTEQRRILLRNTAQSRDCPFVHSGTGVGHFSGLPPPRPKPTRDLAAPGGRRRAEKSHLEFEKLAEIELLPVLTRVTDRADEAGEKAGPPFYSLAKTEKMDKKKNKKCIHVRSDLLHFVVDHVVDAAVGFELGHRRVGRR